MTFQNMQAGRVFTAVIIIFVIGLVLSFVIQFGFVMTRMLDAMDPDLTQDEQEQRIQDEFDALMDETREGSSTFNTLSMIQWGLTAVVAFFVARRTARKYAVSPEQAGGYGLTIGLGVMILYGLCICSSATDILVKLAFFVLIVAASAVGGQLGGQNLGARAPVPDVPGGPPSGALPPGGPVPGSAGRGAPAGGNPETYYNMGVSAALGGRREEARQHFTRVLQMQPRHVPAWLQLANLADTPEQAWNYVQQARSINPTDPAVLQAVDVIWPQVAAKASEPPRVQPPYPGGQQDDVAIPRTQLPVSPDMRAASEPGEETDESDTDADSGAEFGSDPMPPPPPPPPAQS